MTDPAHPEPTASGWFFSPWVLAAAAVFVGLTAWRFDRYPLDGDELFSLKCASQTWPGLIHEVARDFSHPPGSYALQKLWLDAGGDDFRWLHLLPTLLGVAAGIPILMAARRLGLSPAEAGVGLVLVGGCVFLLQLVHWMRMYAPFHFFAAWGFYCLADAVSRDRLSAGRWLLWLLVSVGTVYSHYWGFVVLAGQFAALAVVARRHLLRYFLMGLVVAAAFAPWVVLLVKARGQTGTMTSQIEWMTRPTPKDVLYFLDAIHGRYDFPLAALVGLALFGAVLGAFALTRGRRDWKLWAVCVPAVVVPIAATFVASHVLSTPVWAPRAMVSVVVPYFLLVAAAAGRLPTVPLRVAASAAVLGWVLVAAWNENAGPDQKPQWDEIVRRLQRDEPGDGPVRIHAPDKHYAWILQTYADRLGGRPVVAVADDDLTSSEPAFWVLDTVKEWTEDRKKPVRPAEHLKARGYAVGDEYEFRVRWRTWKVFRAAKAG